MSNHTEVIQIPLKSYHLKTLYYTFLDSMYLYPQNVHYKKMYIIVQVQQLKIKFRFNKMLLARESGNT